MKAKAKAPNAKKASAMKAMAKAANAKKAPSAMKAMKTRKTIQQHAPSYEVWKKHWRIPPRYWWLFVGLRSLAIARARASPDSIPSCALLEGSGSMPRSQSGGRIT